MRFFVGHEWLAAGEHKVRDDAWMKGGSALQGYWERAVAIPEQGRPAITYGWYRDFLQYMLDHEWYTWFAKVIAVGEVLVGHRPDRRGAGRDRRLLRHADELQLPAGRLGQHQPGPLRPRRLPGPGVEGRRLLGARPLPAAAARHPVDARPARAAGQDGIAGGPAARQSGRLNEEHARKATTERTPATRPGCFRPGWK